MVSTRGVKFKFSENEKVLCYEPDPTKAKVLYESKVLELVVSRDSRGRKVPEYLIHFFGWNSSWDRCVAEDFILPDTEENRNLQTKLAEDAALSLFGFSKGKRKRKLPPIIKETLTKKECEGAKENESPPVLQVTESSSESDSSEEEMEKTVEIEIPPVLKEQLEDDCYWITKKNKIIKIPCEPNVVSVLEAYVKHLAVNLLCASPPKNPKNRNEAVTIPEDVEAKLDLCKEVMDGLRVYFDFTLPHLLLYRQEQKQYYTLGTLCKPLGGVKREPQKDESENVQTETKPKVSSPTLHDSPSQTEHVPSKAAASSVSSSTQSTFLYTPARGRPSLRHNLNAKQSSSTEGTTNGGSASPAPSLRVKGSARFQHRDGSSQSTSLKEKKDKTPGNLKRILRSNDKQKTSSEGNSSSVPPDSSKTSKSVNENDSSSPRPETPPMPASPSRPSRTLTKSASQGMSPSSAATSCSSIQSSNQQLPAITNNPLAQRVNPPPPLNFSGVTNSFSSSASSTHSSLSSPRLDEPPCRIINTSGMLSEILSWNMLPPQLYEQIPAPPSLIYGAQHLLRLFVKLPELIYRMNMPRRKLIPLMDYLESFLQYLSERREEIFLPTAYIEADEVSPDGNGPTST